MESVLAEIGATELSTELVLNKIDAVDPLRRRRLANRYPGALQVSALTGEGLDDLKARVAERFAERLRSVRLLVPFEEGRVLAELYDLGAPIEERLDTPEGVVVVAQLPQREVPRFAPYLVAEPATVARAIRQFGVPDSAFAVDLGVVRGLDYYTGTIYETTLSAHPEVGSICSGGRYDDLASYFTDTRLPGVGISIGLTRLFTKLKEAGLLRPLERTPAEVLVTTMDAKYLERYLQIASQLRAAGINTEVYLEPAKLGNQLTYADRKGFRIAIIAGENEFAKDVVQVKNLAAKDGSY